MAGSPTPYAGAAPGQVAGMLQVNARCRQTRHGERMSPVQITIGSVDKSGKRVCRYQAVDETTIKLNMMNRREFAGALAASAWTARSYARVIGAE